MSTFNNGSLFRTITDHSLVEKEKKTIVMLFKMRQIFIKTSDLWSVHTRLFCHNFYILPK